MESALAILQLRSLKLLSFWCFSVVFSTWPGIDLNKPPPECYEEIQSSSATCESFSGKRKYDQVEFCSFSPPASHVRLSYADPSSSAQSVFEPSHAGGKPSKMAGGLVVRKEVRQSGGSGKSNNDASPHSESGQGPKLSQQANLTGFAPVDTGVPTFPPDEKTKNRALYSYFLSNEQVIEELLHRNGVRFNEELKSIPSRWPLEKHETLPYARAINCGEARGAQVFKVLDSSREHIQNRGELIRLYNRLAASLYKLHGEHLNRFTITTFEHREQQERLLGWLYKEIFKPDHSPPVFGVVNLPYSDWYLDDTRMKIGATQVELINYFAQNIQQADETVAHTAHHVFEAYEEQNPMSYAAINQSNNSFREDLDQISTQPCIKASMQFFSSLAEDSDYKWFRHAVITKLNPHFSLIEMSTDVLKKMFDKAKVFKSSLRSYHPKLPIAMFFGKTKHDQNALRMINSRDGTLLSEEYYIIPKFRILLKTVDHLHVNTLEKLSIQGSKSRRMRYDSLKFLAEEITKPKVGLPLIGTCEAVNGDVAPWYDKSYKNFKLFGELQLKMLEYLTEDLTNARMMNVSAYSLAIWYYHHHPSYLRHFTQGPSFPMPFELCICIAHTGHCPSLDKAKAHIPKEIIKH
ncbi:hypothetical protein PGT21_026710 [Puccinia graminis f. sp. tritici]|uniref:Uncharacterized protein n=3 Tax=Puccinia graminis f. sp. tritici TaxID=56615 RepID=A0A5B0LZM8_PUCGR|nr:hypothetical protein PGT21_026710 [Puccinia graminis f. sp. tritici]